MSIFLLIILEMVEKTFYKNPKYSLLQKVKTFYSGKNPVIPKLKCQNGWKYVYR